MHIPETILLSGAERFGVDPNSLAFQGGSDGAVYLCRFGSRACILKFVPLPPDRQAVYEEKLAFMRYLAENGVPVALPLETASGRQYEVIGGCAESASAADAGAKNAGAASANTESASAPRPAPAGDSAPAIGYAQTSSDPDSGNGYAKDAPSPQPDALPRTPQAARRPPPPPHPPPRTPPQVPRRGQVMGRMHALARAYPRWQKSTPGLDAPPSQINDWQGEHAFFASWCQEPKIVEQWQKLYEPLAALPRPRDGFGLVHNDLHMWNFLYHPGAKAAHPITIIDFDVCAYHWFITDIAIAVYHGLTFDLRRSLAQREAYTRHFLQHFMRGYTLENTLDPAWFAHLPLFLRYREILIYIALSNEWPADKRASWQVNMLSEKRGRILRGEAVIRGL